MKKIFKLISLLTAAAMLLASASCGEKEPQVPDVPSAEESVVSEESFEGEERESLIDAEREAIVDEMKEIYVNYCYDISAVVTKTESEDGETVETVSKLHSVERTINSNHELYYSTVTAQQGDEISEILFYKDGKLYTISISGGEAYGYYEEATYDRADSELSAQELGISGLTSITAEMLVNAKATADGDKLLVEVDGSDGSLKDLISPVTDSLDGEYTVKESRLSILFDKKIKSVGLALTAEDDGRAVSVRYDVTFNDYGSWETITVPEPEGIENYKNINGEG